MDLDTLLGVSGGVMLVMLLLLLVILGLCHNQPQDKVRLTNTDEGMKGREELLETQARIPKPPPMPKPPEKYESGTKRPTDSDQKITFSPPVWICEIQTNKLFNKVKLELADKHNELIEVD